ncbi:branched-chain amino acid ABC transporter permease [Solwaraspora sp. WMMD1047]|uniref:branched-chain amino acid ABC transporter permease n=1 Tax=Solwaraspora sp. WMMD1047 TaxID=3016102 RepID=UPI0024166A47|nr:branched-chain amino acid ABC transporter permease [Solwaraspora sp. WMMD1047]MDG4830841.1 branched-chain amino acid ABC transporter permease [Solwaraspora sp. WMMD1047]
MRAPDRTLLRHLAVVAAAALLLAVLSGAFEPFRNYQLATVAGYLCATAGLTVLTGLAGQLSLGHGALMAIGAYTVALSQRAFGERAYTSGWTLPVSLLAAVAVTVAVGAVIGVAAARLHGPYLAGVTLAVAVVVPAVAVTFDGFLNGEQGLSVPVPPPPAALGPYFPTERWQVWIAWAATLPALLVLANLISSRFGRAMRAVRDDEIAARLAGIHVARTKVLAFVVSAAGAGLGGGLLAVLAQSVSPGAFALNLSLFLVVAIVIGGLGGIAGAVWGALLLVALPDLARAVTGLLDLSPAATQRLAGNLPLAVFGAVLIVVMLAAPGGLQGALTRAGRAAVARWSRRRRAGATR